MARTKAERKRYSDDFIKSVRAGEVDGLTVANVQVQASVEYPENATKEERQALKEAAGKETHEVIKVTSVAGVAALQKEINRAGGDEKLGNKVLVNALNERIVTTAKAEGWDFAVIPNAGAPRYIDAKQVRDDNFSRFIVQNQDRIKNDPTWLAGIFADAEKIAKVYAGVTLEDVKVETPETPAETPAETK